MFFKNRNKYFKTIDLITIKHEIIKLLMII
jgi:hypothetical protein